MLSVRVVISTPALFLYELDRASTAIKNPHFLSYSRHTGWTFC